GRTGIGTPGRASIDGRVQDRIDRWPGYDGLGNEMAQTINGAGIEWETARTVAHAYGNSGDDFCVRPFEHRTLFAVLDGLGHGPAAANVARLGVRLLEQAQTHDIMRLVQDCHKGLRRDDALALVARYRGAPR